MKNSLSRMQAFAALRSPALALGGVLLALGAWAATPHFSGPSVGKPAVASKFDGKGFQPNAAVTVVVSAPGGGSTSISAVTSPEGGLSYTLMPSQAGAYTVSVTDSGGKTLAKAVVAVLP
jgi:hypothetical protein